MKKNLTYYSTLQTGGGCMSHFFAINDMGLMIAMDQQFRFESKDMAIWMDDCSNLDAPITAPMEILSDGSQIMVFGGWTILISFGETMVEIQNKNGDLAARFHIDAQAGNHFSNPITFEEPK